MHTPMHCFKHHYIAVGGERREGQKKTRELVQNEFLISNERCCQSAYDESGRKLLCVFYCI
jgi:hypothetical protein